MRASSLILLLTVGCSGQLSGSGPAPPPPPPVDSGAEPGSDAGETLGWDAGPRAAPDAGSPPSIDRPGDRVECFDFPVQQPVPAGAGMGDVLPDIVSHLPADYGSTYYDSDRITWAHETSHGIHAHLRNYFNDTGRRANAFYVTEDRACLVAEPNIRKSDVAAYVPASLHGSRFELYITGQIEWDDTPLYVWDEWSSYVNGGATGVDLVERGLWGSEWRDGVAGQLEFTIYAIAVAMAVEELDPAYFARETQFKEFLAFEARRAMDLYRRGARAEVFAWDEQDSYYRAIRTSPDAAQLRAFVVRVFGATFARELFEID